MPLTELMHYFNDQLQQQAVAKPLPKTGFYFADNQYWARFGNQIFGNRFRTLHSAGDHSIMGYDSALWVRSALGNIISADEVFNALIDLDDVVYLDRITRTLQSLNYLQQFPQPKHQLSLAVQPRHILGVASGHGKTFEAILSDCGLATAKVLLHTRLVDRENLAHFRQAFLSYRAWGYQLGIEIHQPEDWQLLQLWNLKPDAIYIANPLAVPEPPQLLKEFGEDVRLIRVLAGDEDPSIVDANLYAAYLA